MSKLEDFIGRAREEVRSKSRRCAIALPDEYGAYNDHSFTHNHTSNRALSDLACTVDHDLNAACRTIRFFGSEIIDGVAGSGAMAMDQYLSRTERFSKALQRASKDPNRFRSVAALYDDRFPIIEFAGDADGDLVDNYDRIRCAHAVIARYMHQLFGSGRAPDFFSVARDVELLEIMLGTKIMRYLRPDQLRTRLDLLGPMGNAVGNALKYAPGAEVKVSEAFVDDREDVLGYGSVLGDLAGTHRVVVIYDNGPGIDLDALYEKARRQFGYCPILSPPFDGFAEMIERSPANLALLGVSTGPVGVGVKHGFNAGLGLSGSFRYMRQHGGDLQVASERGEGTRVYLAIPHCLILQ